MTHTVEDGTRVLSLFRRMEQSNAVVIDHPAAQAARERALAEVEQNAHKEWLQLAEDVIRYLAQFGPEEWTNDDVWTEIEARCRSIEEQGGTAPYTHEKRALGVVTTRLSRAGIIAKTGRYVASGRKTNHAQPIPVWRRAR